ncbi:MAG: phospholipid/cholesterol/gamma-HCH transport system substrate-binding protein [Verrucomicrobiota bacterium]
MKEPPDILEPLPLNDRGQCVEQNFKFRRVHEITGTFVLIVIAVLIGIILWTGRSQRWFKSNVSLRITLPEAGAAGIRQGSEVYFLGTLVGSVHDVLVDTTGRMEARTTMRHDFFRFVRADSSAVVKRKFGVAGDSFFEITRGTGQPLSEDNASIVCKEQIQSALESAIEEVRREALLILKKTSTGLDAWTKLGVDLGETRQHLDQLTIRLENLSAGVEQGKGTVGKLITDTSLADEAQKLLARANQTIADLQGVVTNLDAASKNVRIGAERLPEITGPMADEAKDLPGLVQQTQTSMRELERLIEAMQHNWLVRKYVNHTNPAPPAKSGRPLSRSD